MCVFFFLFSFLTLEHVVESIDGKMYSANKMKEGNLHKQHFYTKGKWMNGFTFTNLTFVSVTAQIDWVFRKISNVLQNVCSQKCFF